MFGPKLDRLTSAADSGGASCDAPTPLIDAASDLRSSASARDLYGLADAIAATIDAKDGYTHRHSERVAALSRRIALEIGLSDDEQRTVQLAALLHDVGKIAVPDAILKKPGRLTAEEFAEMKKHPMHGARILANIQSPAVAAVLPGVRYHHERWDGTGYPEGLRGDHIPLIGRLLGVADFYDAVTSARAYRPAIPQAEAIAMIVDGAGQPLRSGDRQGRDAPAPARRPAAVELETSSADA